MSGFAIRLETPGFGRDPEQFAGFVRNGLRCLIMANCAAYESDPQLPSIYDAGVVYRREAPGHEQFCDVVRVLRRGHGDCEDLSCAVVAHYLIRLRKFAQAHISWHALSPDHWQYHIRARLEDGTIEDASALLGMNHEPGRWVRRGAMWIYENFPGRTGLKPEPQPVIERRAA